MNQWKIKSFICRSYDQINRGEDYNDIKPVLHIGFLNFTLFKESPQFYAKYKIMNTENHIVYSDNLELRVLDLTHIELATEEDREYHIDYWATLFKTKTWEELKMLAKKNEYIEEATKTIFRMSADDMIRKRCRDREDYYSDLRSYEKAVAAAVAEKDAAVAEKNAAIAEKNAAIAEKDAEISEKELEIEMLRKQLTELKNNKL